MTRDHITDVSIESAEKFEAVLTEAVQKATNAGVEVRGAWEFTTRGSIHDWEVQIVEIDRRPDGGLEEK